MGIIQELKRDIKENDKDIHLKTEDSFS